MIAVFVVKSESYNMGFRDTGSSDVSISVRKDSVLLEDFNELTDYIEQYLNKHGLGIGPNRDSNYLIKYQRKWITVVQCLGDYIVGNDCDRLQYGPSDSCNFNITMQDLHRWFRYYG